MSGDKRQAVLGNQTRRSFVKNIGATAVAAPLASAIPMANARAATPKKGGHLRVAVGSGSTTQNLDPALLEDTQGQMFAFGSLRNALTTVEANGDLAPELCENWETTADASTWVFNLKKGVEFHNGKTMDADDVVASIQHHMSEESKSAAKGLLTAVTEVRKDGPNQVVFTLSGGNADFPFLMSDYHFCIVPAVDGKADVLSGVGTGPFVMKEFEAGVRSTAERNPNYFKDGQPYFDSIEILSISDVTARTNALSTGEVDVIDRCDLKTVDLLARRSNINVTAVSGTLHYTFPMRADTAPYDNNDLRLALKYGVNRQALVDTILKGYGSLGNDHPIGEANRYHAGDLPQRAYDPDKAKFHLKKAGYDSITVDLHASDGAFAGAVDAATLYKEHASPAGIDINVVREPADGYWSNVWMEKPWCACYWSGRPTEDLMFSSAYQSGVPWNDSYWSNDRFDKLLVQARAELDDKTRAAIYYEMQQIVSDQGSVVVPMFANYVGAHSDKLAHGEIGKSYDMDGGRMTERWWFA